MIDRCTVYFTQNSRKVKVQSTRSSASLKLEGPFARMDVYSVSRIVPDMK